MRKKNIVFGIVGLCVVISMVFTESLLPLLIVLFLLDFYRENSVIKRLLYYVRSSTKIKVKYLEWALAIVLSVWLFFVVRNTFVSVYTFHTSSMNGTLESGDILVVNKFGIGARRYANSVKWYHRGPEFKHLTYQDIIVFNFPEGDTLLMKRPTESYYYLKRKYGSDVLKDGDGKLSDLHFFQVEERPRFVKRIYGLPGDSIKIENGVFYANDKVLKYPEKSIDRYLVSEQQKKDIMALGVVPYNELSNDDGLVLELYRKDFELIKDKGIHIKPDYLPKNYPDPEVFPFDRETLWNMNYLGPLYVPKKGDIVELNKKNVELYRRIIDVFEENNFQYKNGTCYINGKIAHEYKFKMNYYWVMGDNFTHSFDSRFWGFVPENHIIGTVGAVF